MRRPLIVPLLLTGALSAGPAELEVVQDPASPGFVRVAGGTGRVEVTWVRPKGKPVHYRSPERGGFTLCKFLVHVGAAKVEGRIPVVVRRGKVRLTLELDYDGKSCTPVAPARRPAPAPKAVTPAPGQGSPPVPPAPLPAAPVATPEPSVRVSDALIESSRAVRRGEYLVFEVVFDRPLRLPANTRVALEEVLRLDRGGRLLEGRNPFPVTLVDGRTVTWRVGLVHLKALAGSQLVAGERLRISFVLDEREFRGVLAGVELS